MNPFTESHAHSIGSIGEIELINRIKSWLGSASPESPRGIGDDCAVIPLPMNEFSLLVTTDPIVYGHHFDDTISPESAASKLIRRNLSDIAAMGGSPASVVISLSAPPNLSISWLERFYARIAIEADSFSIEISGGDICSTESHLGLYVTLFGYAENRTLNRKTGNIGDAIYVTGSLGGTRIKKHYDFQPRLREGQWLAENPNTTSCMDISDGLGKDLPLLLPDGISAILDAKRIPISKDANTVATESNHSPLYHAINDGEDFELLFTLSKNGDHEAFLNQWQKAFDTSITKIGYLIEKSSDKSIVIENADGDIDISGYEHYRQA